MAGNVKPIPQGYHSVTPYLYVKGATKALDFYKQALGATEKFRMPMADGRIGHAEITIGDSVVMLADEFLERNVRGPQTLGGVSSSLMIYVDRKSTRLNSSHRCISYAVFCLKKKIMLIAEGRPLPDDDMPAKRAPQP